MMQVEPGRNQLKTFSLNGGPIRTMGGLTIVPDMGLADVSASDAAMLILPGGRSWESDGNKKAAQRAGEFHATGIPVAAICGATLGLALAGVLDSVEHTSNSKEYILMSDYAGGDNYRDALAVSDKGVITAPGTGSLEFSREVFKVLGLYTDSVLKAWYRLFKTGEPEAFAELMAAAGGE